MIHFPADLVAEVSLCAPPATRRVWRLVSRTWNRAILSRKHCCGKRPHDICQCITEEKTERLLFVYTHGADMNHPILCRTTVWWDEPPVPLACSLGKLSVVRVLSPLCTDKVRAVKSACFGGQLEVIAWCFQQGGDWVPNPSELYALVITACDHGHVLVAKWLFARCDAETQGCILAIKEYSYI